VPHHLPRASRKSTKRNVFSVSTPAGEGSSPVPAAVGVSGVRSVVVSDTRPVRSTPHGSDRNCSIFPTAMTTAAELAPVVHAAERVQTSRCASPAVIVITTPDATTASMSDTPRSQTAMVRTAPLGGCFMAGLAANARPRTRRPEEGAKGADLRNRRRLVRSSCHAVRHGSWQKLRGVWRAQPSASGSVTAIRVPPAVRGTAVTRPL